MRLIVTYKCLLSVSLHRWVRTGVLPPQLITDAHGRSATGERREASDEPLGSKAQ
jgi:hypothetical protein